VAAALAGAVAGALVGCSSEDPEAAEASEGPEVPEVPGAELAGRWAHYDVVAYEEPTMKTLIISYGFTDFTVEDGRLVESEEFCHAEQASDQPIETTISDAATQAIVPESTPVEVTEIDGGLRVQRPATPTPVGIDLEDPAEEPLPQDPSDPRIVDDDGDGKPGITVEVAVGGAPLGEIYLARREIFAYDMATDGPDTVTGTVTDSSEQLLIGASDPVLAATPAQWTQFEDLSRSPIILRRVEADWDCERLMAERDALFPPEPTPDW
jgi:hypothetical protein